MKRKYDERIDFLWGLLEQRSQEKYQAVCDLTELRNSSGLEEFFSDRDTIHKTVYRINNHDRKLIDSIELEFQTDKDIGLSYLLDTERKKFVAWQKSSLGYKKEFKLNREIVDFINSFFQIRYTEKVYREQKRKMAKYG